MNSTVDLAKVRYDTTTGLVPVVVQDVDTGAVLMLAYANREAIKRTLATRQAWFWSRSRQEYWHKGATSGNVQHIEDVRMDCDGDSVLYLVHPAGPACHTGEATCFYRSVTHGEAGRSDAAADPTDSDRVAIPHAASPTGVSMSLEPDTFRALLSLWNVLDERYRDRPEGSYTTYLYTHGTEKIGKKVGEEAVEVALAALREEITGRSETLAEESADLLYHLMALWRFVGLSPERVMEVLENR